MPLQRKLYFRSEQRSGYYTGARWGFRSWARDTDKIQAVVRLVWNEALELWMVRQDSERTPTQSCRITVRNIVTHPQRRHFGLIFKWDCGTSTSEINKFWFLKMRSKLYIYLHSLFLYPTEDQKQIKFIAATRLDRVTSGLWAPRATSCAMLLLQYGMIGAIHNR